MQLLVGQVFEHLEVVFNLVKGPFHTFFRRKTVVMHTWSVLET